VRSELDRLEFNERTPIGFNRKIATALQTEAQAR
jgi:hypothetical protein